MKLDIEKLEKEVLKEVRLEHNLLRERIRVAFDKYRPSSFTGNQKGGGK